MQVNHVLHRLQSEPISGEGRVDPWLPCWLLNCLCYVPMANRAITELRRLLLVPLFFVACVIMLLLAVFLLSDSQFAGRSLLLLT